ncbi:hypothetical protein CRUP_022680, partial [Coryphaenoides rupestris]
MERATKGPLLVCMLREEAPGVAVSGDRNVWRSGGGSADVNECEGDEGGCEGSCCNTIGSFYCKCPPGSRLGPDGKACQAVNSCAVKNGGCEHKCVDTADGLYRCECRKNYQLTRDGKHCQHVDECGADEHRCSHGCIEMEIVNSCEKDNGGCSHGCEHTTSGPLCSCNHGYHLDLDGKTCVDNDECVNGESCCSQLCRNYPGGYECSCIAGYRPSPDGCACDDVDECLSPSSGCKHYCVNVQGSYECFCRAGFRLGQDQYSCIALYGRGLEEEEDEDEEEGVDDGDVPVRRFPGLLFRRPPQLLRYTPALRSPHVSGDGGGDDDDDGGHDDGSDYDNGDEGASERWGELRLVSQIVCLGGSFGEDCGLSCEDCVNGGVCSADRDRSCLQGTYGPACNSLCRCQNGGSCDPVTGSCVCPTGVQGPLCTAKANSSLSSMPSQSTSASLQTCASTELGRCVFTIHSLALVPLTLPSRGHRLKKISSYLGLSLSTTHASPASFSWPSSSPGGRSLKGCLWKCSGLKVPRNSPSSTPGGGFFLLGSCFWSSGMSLAMSVDSSLSMEAMRLGLNTLNLEKSCPRSRSWEETGVREVSRRDPVLLLDLGEDHRQLWSHVRRGSDQKEPTYTRSTSGVGNTLPSDHMRAPYTRMSCWESTRSALFSTTRSLSSWPRTAAKARVSSSEKSSLCASNSRMMRVHALGEPPQHRREVRSQVDARRCLLQECDCRPPAFQRSVSPAPSGPAVSGGVPVQVAGHVTRRAGSASRSVRPDYVGTSANW